MTIVNIRSSQVETRDIDVNTWGRRGWELWTWTLRKSFDHTITDHYYGTLISMPLIFWTRGALTKSQSIDSTYPEWHGKMTPQTSLGIQTLKMQSVYQDWGTFRVFALGLQFTHFLMPFTVACPLLHVNLRDVFEDALFRPICSLENMLTCLVNLASWLDGHMVSTARGKLCSSCLQGDGSLGGDPTDSKDVSHHFWFTKQDIDQPKYSQVN